MPRGQKSKQRSRAKRQQTRSGNQSQDVQPTAEESAPTSLVDEGASFSSPEVFSPQKSQVAMPSSASVAVSVCTRRDVKREGCDAGARNPDAEAEGPNKCAHKRSSRTCQAETSTQLGEVISWKKNVLVHFLLEKFKLKEHVTQADMMKVVNKKFEQHFSEIFKRASEHLELVFGVELQEIDPHTHSYALVNKLGLTSECSMSANKGLPKTGLVMSLLGVIFMRGNRATEEEICDFLNSLGIHSEKRHTLFGEPQSLITKDLVQDGYLECRQIPGSNPPSYEYIWGFRAHAETTKMKVLEVLAKIKDTVPRAFPVLYAEALKDQEERARAAASQSPSNLRLFDPDCRCPSRCSFRF
ncbi:melanoma-associated antigen B2-like [Perognathus longimembris pacificus]|uniref:melanoma-associated antigen B2-like n=1 Tax=Perognathus longimembris pacificus TaxID=214514 RepID=UPI0020189935|nr:melanoma-associated antigen B2-like [Perognathus longimembris pacificus]